MSKKPKNHEKNRRNSAIETESPRNIVEGKLKRILLRTTLRLKKPGKALQKSPKATSEQNSNLAPSELLRPALERPPPLPSISMSTVL